MIIVNNEDSRKIEGLEHKISQIINQSGVPGASIVVIKDCKVIFRQSYGMRNIKENLPMTPDTLNGIASCTKSFTALAIMTLVENDKLRLNDPINKYLPFTLDKERNPITVHHLLTMTSGVSELGMAGLILSRLGKGQKNLKQFRNWDDFYEYVNGAFEFITANPGEKFMYNNEGYALLSQIIEVISGLPYEHYVKDYILNPIEMKRSTYIKEIFEKDSNHSIHYLNVKKSANFFNDKFLFGCGGLMSSINELTNYIELMLNIGIFKEKQLVSKESLDLMWTPHITCNLSRRTIHEVEKESYGYGWIILNKFLGEKIVYHLGGGPATSAAVWLVPDKKIGISIVSNMGGAGIEMLYMIPLMIIACLLNKDLFTSVKFFNIKQTLDILTGNYTTYRGYCPISVIKKNYQLYLYADPNPELDWGINVPLIPERDDLGDLKFYFISGPGGRTPITFRIGDTNKVELYWNNLRFKKEV